MELRLPRVRSVWILAGVADVLFLALRIAGVDSRLLGLGAIILFALAAFLVAAWVGAIVFFGRERSSEGLAYIGILALQALVLLLLLRP